MIEPRQIRRQLDKICASPQFRSTTLLRDFLSFIVGEALAGNFDQIKEYTVATSVYGRPPSFDPKLDSIVRVEAVKLRARLETYYDREGFSDELTIRVPKGGYVPEFINQGRPLVSGSGGESQISELCDIASVALMRNTPASLSIAANCFPQARNLNPADPRPHIGIANCHAFLLTNEAAPAAEVTSGMRWPVSRGLQLNDNGCEAHVASSIYHSALDGVNGMAMKEARRALELEPRNPIGHFWAPALLSAMGRHEASVEHMRQAIRCAPNCTLFAVYLGRVFYYAGRNKDAVEVLRRVAQVDPALAFGHLWTALAYTELEQHDEAVEAGSHAVKLSETNATLSAYAYVLARAGRLDDAGGIFDRLTVKPTCGYVSPVQLALIADALNRKQEAFLHLAQAERERAWILLLRDVDPRLKRVLSR